jgi:hypothetical protein
MKVTPSQRASWGLEFSVRKHGYIWAMTRAMEGKDYQNWQTENGFPGDTDSPQFSFWIGFSNGIREFTERLEESTLDELVAQERAAMEAVKFDNLSMSYRIEALEVDDNDS